MTEWEPRIWGLSGKMGSGKDTIKEALETRIGGSWRKIAIGDIIKEYASRITVQCEHGHLRTAVGWEHPTTGEIIVPAVGDEMPIVDGKGCRIVPARPERCVCGSAVAKPVDMFEAGHSAEGRAVLQWLAEAEITGNLDRWITPVMAQGDRYLEQGHHVAWIGIRTIREADAAIAHDHAAIIRLDVDEETQRERLLARDGHLPADDSFQHSTEIELDGYDKWPLTIDANGDVETIVEDILRAVTS